MSTTKRLNDPSIEKVTVAPEGSTIPVIDATGKLSGISVGNLLVQARGAVIVGGRNLLKGSNTEVSHSNYWVTSHNLTDAPAAGETVTLTVWGTTEASKFMAYNSGDQIKLANVERIAEGVYRATFKWTVNSAPNTNVVLFGGDGKHSTVKKVKLERGNIATDWTPAPEDILSRLDALENRGGVNACILADWQKGGQHECNEGIDGSPAEEHHDRCDSRQRNDRRCRSQFYSISGNIPDRQQYSLAAGHESMELLGGVLLRLGDYTPWSGCGTRCFVFPCQMEFTSNLDKLVEGDRYSRHVASRREVVAA